MQSGCFGVKSLKSAGRKSVKNKKADRNIILTFYSFYQQKDQFFVVLTSFTPSTYSILVLPSAYEPKHEID